jgi:hypothetical protein
MDILQCDHARWRGAFNGVGSPITRLPETRSIDGNPRTCSPQGEGNAIRILLPSLAPRVAPWQPGKMAARLQHATSSGRPVLLRVDKEAGDGPGPTKLQSDRQLADQMAFFHWQIGKPDYQPLHRCAGYCAFTLIDLGVSF